MIIIIIIIIIISSSSISSSSRSDSSCIVVVVGVVVVGLVVVVVVVVTGVNWCHCDNDLVAIKNDLQRLNFIVIIFNFRDARTYRKLRVPTL